MGSSLNEADINWKAPILHMGTNPQHTSDKRTGMDVKAKAAAGTMLLNKCVYANNMCIRLEEIMGLYVSLHFFN